MPSSPFIIYGLPRSRTSWIASFLSYKDWDCYHEKFITLHSMADAEALFARPNTGTVETGAAYGRCLLKWLIPDLKEVVVLRPVEEVVASLITVSKKDGFSFDNHGLRKMMEKGRRALDKIAKDPRVLVVNYADLETEETCARLFEFCLPYVFDKAWWELYKDKNIQLDYLSWVVYRQQNASSIAAFKSLCKRELMKLCRTGAITA